jgi:hypothetical protein
MPQALAIDPSGWIETFNGSFEMKQKKYLVLLVTCFLSMALSAQNLVQMKCYFDGDEENAQYFPIANLAEVDAPFEIDVSDLTKGVHKMYIEVKNNQGKWSLYDAQNIQVFGGVQMAQLNLVEYFYDSDPGLGNGIQVAVSGTAVNQDFALSVDGLSNGIHRLYIRVRNGAGQWSISASKLIEVNSSDYAIIVAGEYFLDSDPGQGQGIPIDINGFLIDEDLNLSMAGVPNGVHKLYVRVMDDVGQWSHADEANIQIGTPGSNVFSTSSPLIEAEYYFDTDPGLGNGIALDFADAYQVNQDFNITLPALTDGMHVMYVRVTNESGEWSEIAQDTLFICDIQEPVITTSGTFCAGTNVVLDAGAGYTGYSWSTNSTGQTTTINQSGTYTLTVQDGFCSTSVNATYNFVEVPEPIVTTDGPLCNGNTVTLNAGSGYTTYFWSNNSSLPTTQISGSGSLSLTVTQGNCSTTLTEDYLFTELAEPVISVAGALCTGNIVTLNGGAGYDSYTWSTNSTNQTTTINSSGTYSLTVTDGNCSSTATETYTFTTLPAPQIEIIGTLCLGNSVSLDAGDGYSTYSWSNSALSQITSVNTSGTYSVIVSLNGCSATASEVINFIGIQAPVITIQGELCPGNVVTLDAGPGYSTYSWNSGSQNQTILVNQNGNYSVIVTQGDCTTSTSLSVAYIQLPTPDIIQSGNTMTTSTSGYTYQWYFQGNPIAGATAQSYTGTQSGTYVLEISNGDCFESSNNYNFIYNSVNELNAGWNFYPNPADDKLHLQSGSSFNYTLEDESGRIIARGNSKNVADVDVSAIASGVYFLRIEGVAQKVIVQH